MLLPVSRQMPILRAVDALDDVEQVRHAPILVVLDRQSHAVPLDDRFGQHKRLPALLGVLAKRLGRIK